jgi:hypothetical protein
MYLTMGASSHNILRIASQSMGVHRYIEVSYLTVWHLFYKEIDVSSSSRLLGFQFAFRPVSFISSTRNFKTTLW